MLITFASNMIRSLNRYFGSTTHYLLWGFHLTLSLFCDPECQRSAYTHLDFYIYVNEGVKILPYLHRYLKQISYVYGAYSCW